MRIRNKPNLEENDDLLVTTARLDTEKIVAFRKRNHLTQKDFADKVGVTQLAVSRWEKNINIPSKLNLKAMAKTMNVEPGDLILLPNTPWQQESCNPISDPISDPEFTKKTGTQILSLLYEANALITDYVSFIKKASELAILESLLKNSLSHVKTQRQQRENKKETKNI